MKKDVGNKNIKNPSARTLLFSVLIKGAKGGVFSRRVGLHIGRELVIFDASFHLDRISKWFSFHSFPDLFANVRFGLGIASLLWVEERGRLGWMGWILEN